MADFRDWLGETKYMHGLDTIPPSRFSNTNTNGLYEYSPFQCCVGLFEALELSYLIGIHIWDEISEPTMIIHLHNMVVQKGYLQRPVGLWASIEELFGQELFPGKTPPKSGFARAFLLHVGNAQGRSATAQRAKLRRNLSKNANDIPSLLDPIANFFLKSRSLAQLLRMAGWDADRIPDKELPLGTMMSTVRLSQLKTRKDAVTGQLRLDNPDLALLQRALARGYTEESILGLSLTTLSLSNANNDEESELIRKMQKASPSDFEGTQSGKQESQKKHGSSEKLMDVASMLELYKWGIFNSVSGDARVMGFSFLCVTIMTYMLFDKIEERLKLLRNRAYTAAYEDPSLPGDKPSGMVAMALELTMMNA